MKRFWDKVDKNGPNGCWVWTARPDGNGYGRFKLDDKSQYAHRVSWEWVNGPIPEGLCILHRCDNPLCVRSDHLFLGTHRDNVDDKVKKGRQAQGSANGRAKLNEDAVRWIRSLMNLGCPRTEVAEVFAISRRLVCKIVDRDIWRHVI